MGDSRSGILSGIAAYALWGLMPLYFTALKAVPRGEVLAERILFSGVLVAILLSVFGRWREVRRAFASPAVLRVYFASALLLSSNWVIYIHGITSGQAVETSLGYFINPLLNVVLGVVLFREPLRPFRRIAVVLAAVGVAILVVRAGHFPWIALSLALTFGLYGLIRRTAPLDAFVGVSVETILLCPLALAYLIWLTAGGDVRFGAIDRTTDALLCASGAITIVPLLLFGQAARSIRFTTLGFLQYLAPSIQFLMAVTVLGETVDATRWQCFACIWAGLAIYSVDLLLAPPPVNRTD